MGIRPHRLGPCHARAGRAREEVLRRVASGETRRPRQKIKKEKGPTRGEQKEEEQNPGRGIGLPWCCALLFSDIYLPRRRARRFNLTIGEPASCLAHRDEGRTAQDDCILNSGNRPLVGRLLVMPSRRHRTSGALAAAESCFGGDTADTDPGIPSPWARLGLSRAKQDNGTCGWPEQRRLQGPTRSQNERGSPLFGPCFSSREQKNAEDQLRVGFMHEYRQERGIESCRWGS